MLAVPEDMTRFAHDSRFRAKCILSSEATLRVLRN
jgi:hypothetical protein